MFSKELVGLLT